ncbi:MAG: hypothetical protein IJV64_12950, partial [Oscillospiraceae bacterium]|nr:hypothetical protein [Oscillospiraceae bacterium]
TTGAVANGAGVYLRTGTTLALGSGDIEAETLTIYDNTAGGEASNLRMLVQKLGNDPKQRNMISADHPDILLYSNLKLSEDKALGWIGVCTPGEAGTQFGLADASNRTNMAYFVSDDGIMTGKLDEGDNKKIVWYAPPVCQITDANGKLLSYGPDHVAATFSSLYDAYIAFNTLEEDYFRDGDRNVTPVQIQMLVSRYPLNNALPALTRSGTLTTEPNTPVCTITRGAELTESMFKVAPGIEMNIARITLDGGAKYGEEGENVGLSAGTDKKVNGGILWADQLSSLVLGQQAELRNSATSGNGGAVYLSGGATMEMKFNSVISDCVATGNGGAIYVGSGASVTTTESPTVKGSHAEGNGGAIYVYDSATVNLGTTTDVGPTIANNSSDADGAGIYLFGTTSKLNLQGKIDFLDNEKQEAIKETNGGEDYAKPRQDIYLQYNNTSNAPNINVTGEIVADAGSIWVWAYHRSHYLLDMQFAVIQSGVTVTDETFKAFRDAVDDTSTENRTGQYYRGVRGENELYIYWGVDGIDLSFKKTDGFGNLIPNATFTLYKDIECSTPLEKDGPVTAKSSDGTAKSLTENIIPEGVVLFEKIPVGVYYMRETGFPDGYVAFT